MTERRKAAFVDALRQTGSLRWAATIASPHLGGEPRADGHGRGWEAFRDTMRRDPVFVAQVEDALNEALGKAEQLLAERMLTPDTRPIVDKNGQVVAVATDHRNANALLLRFLERHDVHWAPRKQLSGDINHQHQHSHAHSTTGPGYTITARDVQSLPEERQQLLLELLDEVEDSRAQEVTDGRELPALPAPAQH